AVRAPETPGPLSDLAMKLLAKKPDDRPTTAQEVLDALNSIEQRLASGLAGSSMLPGTLTSSMATAKTVVMPSKKKPMRTHHYAAMAAAAVLGVALAFYLLFPPKTGDNGVIPDKHVGGQQPVASNGT